MFQTMKFLRLACCSLLGTVAWAHDTYIMPAEFTVQPGVRLKITYQNGDDFPEGDSPVKVERLRRTELLFRSGSIKFENLQAHEKNTTASVPVPHQGIGILVSETVPNFIELPQATFESYLQHEYLTHVMEWRRAHGEAEKAGKERYSKYAKSLILSGKVDDFYRTAAGLTIEFVPEANPYTLKPGATLPVRLLFRGRPASNAPVQVSWIEGGKSRTVLAGRTDSQGRVRVPIRSAGPHRLHSIVMERCREPQVADWESFWASLTFAIPASR